MSSADPLAALTDSQRNELELLLMEFDRCWKPTLLSEYCDRVAEKDEHYRGLALSELVKIDLQRRWSSGDGLLLEDYFERIPSLGPAERVESDLILGEFEARRAVDAKLSLDSYAHRFPSQFDHLLARDDLESPHEAAEASIETSRVADVRDTARTKKSQHVALPKEFGRYRILRELGSGAMGTVYLAHDSQLDRQVAIKTPGIEGDKHDESVTRFYREARAAAKIHHRNICPIYDVGDIDGRHFISMAFVEGRTLSKAIESNEQPSPKSCAILAHRLASALAEAHHHNVVHRDLKPANIMIDVKQEPVVMDFGLAFQTDVESRMTQSGAMVGTPAYMSPEQLSGDPSDVGPLADIYSLGVILYELLTGRLPFRGAIAQVMYQIVHEEPLAPSQLRSEVDPELEMICARMMAKSRDERYQSMGEVASALKSYVKSLAQAQDSEPSVLRAASADRAGTVQVNDEGGVCESTRFSQTTDLAGSGGVFSRTRTRLLLLAFTLFLALGIAFLVRTPHGVVSIAVLDHMDGLEVMVDGSTIELKTPEEVTATDHELTLILNGKELSFDPKQSQFVVDDDRRLTVFVGDLQLSSPSFAVARHGETVLKIMLSPLGDGEARQVEYALKFDGIDDWVETPLEYDGSYPITIECSIKPLGIPPHKHSEIISNYRQRNGLGLTLDTTSWQAFAYETEVGRPSDINCDRPPELGRRIHLALTYDQKTLTLFVDGHLIGSVDLKGPHRASIGPFHFGGDGYRERYLHGLIDEVRVSKVVRYSSAFTPLASFEPDDNTLALYRFDDGIGGVLKDASGNGHHGTIHGAKWVRRPYEGRIANSPPLATAPFAEARAKAHQKDWADYLDVPVAKKIDLGGGKTMTMVLIPPGEFLMGSTADEESDFLAQATDDPRASWKIPLETPQHRVTISQPFYLGKYEITQGEWETIMGSVPSSFQDSPSHPVNRVSWEDTQTFIAKLNQEHRFDGMAFILPTEAQWEHACRAGTTTAWHFGDSQSALQDYAWFKENSGLVSRPKPGRVGSRRPNRWGLYDMHGNLREWCADWQSNYQTSDATDPRGPEVGQSRVWRSGCWDDPFYHCRSASRSRSYPGHSDSRIGFRLAMELDTETVSARRDSRTNLWTDTEAAQWILDQGGMVEVRADGERITLKSGVALPSGEIILNAIILNNAPVTDVEFSRMAKLRHVQKLELDRCPAISGELLKYFASCAFLEYLDLSYSGCNDNVGLELHRFARLRHLDLDATKIGVKTLHSLDGLSQIQSLSLAKTRIRDDDIRHLANLDNLEVLNLSFSSVGDSCLTHLKALPRLQKLSLRSANVTDTGALELAAFKHLQKLELTDSKLTNEGLRSLAQVTTLRGLNLAGTSISDEGLGELTTLENLFGLSLGSTNITDAGLSHLQKLRLLRSLSVENTDITDTGVQHLVKISGLRHLMLAGSKITPQGVAQIRRALPGCNVVH